MYNKSEIKYQSSVNDNKDWIKGIIVALPIVIGYIPIAITFGILSVQANVPLYYAVLMSILVFAGASQFVAISMISAGAGSISIITATLVLNLRHLIMSMSLMNKFKNIPLSWKVPLSFGVTDEVFAVASAAEKESSEKFLAAITLSSYCSWIVGTLIGGLLANIIPASISSGMSIALYAMFISLLVPSIRKSWRIGVIAIISGLLCFVFSAFFERGWAIIMATITGSFFGIIFNIGDEE
ncbi:AzlC family ABC transporter permease [Longirhabdus pacifica]|uniref:AzlC family ABC transporter permease n=1 Tax=Longirhabdus pacifica TaxID=2305227 RepID=UPI001009341F|nr:AzlC family ABC transporter permease [Longirhabdus pacifica]